MPVLYDSNGQRVGIHHLPPLPPLLEPELEPEPDPSETLLIRILGAVEGLKEALSSLPTPVVDVEAPDLAAIVTAVNSLKPGATPDEIGEAIARRMSPAPTGPSAELEAMVRALEGIDARLKGLGRQAYGGGSVSLNKKDLDALINALGGDPLTDVQLRASPVPVSDRSAAEWAEIASATNATATATRVAVVGQSHHITGVVASFDIAPSVGARLDLREGGVNKLSLFVADPAELELTRPFKMTANTTATLVLSAGGIGATGLITMQGFSV